MSTQDDLKQSLAHVLWIGGGPDAGKTSVATRLSEKHNLQFYSLDEKLGGFWMNHISKAPSSLAYKLISISPDERWLQPPEEQLQNYMIVEDEMEPLFINELLAMPTDRPILFEGNLAPGRIEPYLTTKQQAIWMVATESFSTASFYRREKHIPHNKTSDPKQTLENRMGRIRLSVGAVKQEVHARGLTLLEIDGTRSIEEVAAMVEAHFKPFL